MAEARSHTAVVVAERARRALSYAREALATAATLFQEVPVAGEVCATFLAFEELVDTARSNKPDLAILRELCDVVIKSVLREQYSEHSAGTTGMEQVFQRLKKHIEGAREVAQLCNGRVKQILLSRKISRDIAAVKKNVRDFAVAENVALAQNLHAKLDDMDTRLSVQEEHKPSRAQVSGAPRIRDWYVERERVMFKVCDHLGVRSDDSGFNRPRMVGLAGAGGTGKSTVASMVVARGDGIRSNDSGFNRPRMVGLVGAGGAGKSTVASMVVARGDVKSSFHNGVLWLPVGHAAKNRLPALMFDLAEKVYKTVMKKTCRRPRQGNVLVNPMAGAADIQEVVDDDSRRFLVVADDVWEVEVLRELERAGVWVLYTTRKDNLLPEDPAVRVDEVLEDEAEMVLRGAAELIDDTRRLPDAAYELMRKCEYSVLDLVLVGRWSEVRRRSDDPPWKRALGRILEAQKRGETGTLSWRAAVLRAGLDELAWNNPKSKELYLALAVLPTGMTFPLEVGAFLLYGNNCSPEDMMATEKILEDLERWSIVTLEVDGEYRVHEDHIDFVWDCLLANQETRARVLPRWQEYISSVQALNTYTSGWLVKIWSVLAKAENAGVEGGRVVPSPYDPVLDAMDSSNLELPGALKKAAEFHFDREDWEDAYDKYSRLTEIEEATHGGDSLAVASVLYKLGMCANEIVGREEETERLLRRALRIQQEELEPDDPDVANTLHSLGVCIRKAGKIEEAEQLLRPALAIRKGNRNDPLSLARIQYSLGVCAYKSGRLQEAEEDLLKEALASTTKWLGHDHPQVANALYDLGLCDDKAGRTGGGEEKLREALKFFEEKMGPDHQDVADTLFCLGKCALEGGGRISEAKGYFRRALVIREKKQAPKQRKKVADTLHALGVCASKAGDPKEAQDYFLRANGLLKEQSVTAFRFEAAVKGGTAIPKENLEGNNARKVSGFMESVTSYMHSKVESKGLNYGEVLDEARDLHAAADLQHLLQELAVDAKISPGSIQCKGVFSPLSTKDFEYASTLRRIITLRGTAKLSPGGDRLSVFVSPVLVPPDPPVASALVAPAESPRSMTSANSEDELERDLPACFYMRIPSKDDKGIMRRVGELAAENDVSIHVGLQTHFEDEQPDFVITTYPCKQSQVDQLSASIDKEEWATGVPLVMPIFLNSLRVRRFSDAGVGTSPTKGKHDEVEPSDARAIAIVEEPPSQAVAMVVDEPDGATSPRENSNVHKDAARSSRPCRSDWLQSCGDIIHDDGVPSKGVPLSMHSATRLAACFDGSGRARVLHVPAGDMSGHGVLCLTWRDKHGHVEIKAAPQERKHVEEVRLLDSAYMIEVEHRGETGTCLIKPVIQGPRGSTFPPGTASISYFLGWYEHLVLTEGEQGGPKGMTSHILDTYFPVMKMDDPHSKWEADGVFTVVWKDNEIWLQKELLHFCKVGKAKKVGWRERLRQLSCRGDSPLSTPAPTPSVIAPPTPMAAAPTPLGSTHYPPGTIEVHNATKMDLDFVIVPETHNTEGAAAGALEGTGGLTAGGVGLTGGGKKEQSTSYVQQRLRVFDRPRRNPIRAESLQLASLPGDMPEHNS